MGQTLETHCNLFVLDHSQSIPTAASEQALAMINASMNNRRKAKDIAGVVAFGKEARIELPPYAYPLGHSMLAIQSTLDRQYSDVSRVSNWRSVPSRLIAPNA